MAVCTFNAASTSSSVRGGGFFARRAAAGRWPPVECNQSAWWTDPTPNNFNGHVLPTRAPTLLPSLTRPTPSAATRLLPGLGRTWWFAARRRLVRRRDLGLRSSADCLKLTCPRRRRPHEGDAMRSMIRSQFKANMLVEDEKEIARLKMLAVVGLQNSLYEQTRRWRSGGGAARSRRPTSGACEKIALQNSLHKNSRHTHTWAKCSLAATHATVLSSRGRSLVSHCVLAPAHRTRTVAAVAAQPPSHKSLFGSLFRRRSHSHSLPRRSLSARTLEAASGPVADSPAAAADNPSAAAASGRILLRHHALLRRHARPWRSSLHLLRRHLAVSLFG